MSAKALTVAALVAIAIPASSRAQSTFGVRTRPSLGIAAGASSPMGEFGNNLQIGYHLVAALSYLPPLAPVGVRIEGMYNEFAPGSPSLHGKAKVLAATGNVVLTSPGVMGPYLIGGLGYYKTTSTISSGTFIAAGPPNSTDLGYNAGAGIRFGLSGFSAYMEMRFHMAGGLNKNPRYVPISFGLTF